MQLTIALTGGHTSEFDGVALWVSIALSRALRNVGNMVRSDVIATFAICCAASSHIGGFVTRESDWVDSIIEPNQVGVVAAACATANTILNLNPGAQTLAIGCADLLGLCEGDSRVAPCVSDTVALTCLALSSLRSEATQESEDLWEISRVAAQAVHGAAPHICKPAVWFEVTRIVEASLDHLVA